MKAISWNVNGLRSCISKGFESFLYQESPDFMCVQETKMQEEQLELHFWGYHRYMNSAEKKGYSGTMILAKQEPLAVTYGLGDPYYDNEGRVITLEYDTFYLVNEYVPNAKPQLERIDYRMEWEDRIRTYLKELAFKKSVILCGDLNVAHEEIDLTYPDRNHNSAGFSDKERGKMTLLLDAGFIDSFRYLYPDKKGAYTWWSYFSQERERNIGWRIDYFILSASLASNLKEAKIYDQIEGSDHCPVGIEIQW